MRSAFDVVIIGGGPAGLSAALMLGRARRSVLVVDDGHQRNRPVRESHGYLAFDGCSPQEFLNQARSQLDAYSTIDHVTDCITGISGTVDDFAVTLKNGEAVKARRIVFAAGMIDELPELQGIRELWGRGVFVCPYCDGWEFRDRRIAVLGETRSALELAVELWNWSKDLVVCPTSTGDAPEELSAWQRAAGIELAESLPVKISERDGTVVLEYGHGKQVECAVAFVCAPLRQRSNLPAELGCEVAEGCTLRVDENNRTTVAGCYAAGDCITKHHQLVFAAASGARAAIAINEEFYEADARALVKR